MKQGFDFTNLFFLKKIKMNGSVLYKTPFLDILYKILHLNKILQHRQTSKCQYFEAVYGNILREVQ